MDIFTYQDYRQVVRHKIKENRDVRGYQSILAKAAGCQRSYFSQALNGQVQLTPEHGLGLARLWNLSSEETDHFMDLIHWDRAGNRELGNYYAARVKARQKAREDLVHRLSLKPSALTDDKTIYYTSWYHGAIHILCTIPQFQTPEAMAHRLQMPMAMVMKSLNLLIELDLIQVTPQGRYLPKSFNIHLPRSSPWTHVNHAQWRQRANFSLMGNDGDGVHYTAIHSLSHADIKRLKEMLYQFIESSRVIVQDSKEEEMICVTLDLFRG